MAIGRLLDTLDALGFIARHLHPPRLEELVATLGDRDAVLREALADAVWPDQLRDHVRARGRGNAARLRRAARGRCFGRIAAGVSRAAAGEPRLEALYPLAAVMPTVSRWFLASNMR